MINELKVQIALEDSRLSLLRAAYYKTRIENKQYIDRIVHKGSFDGPILTEEELLKDELATMHRHIALAQEHLDYAKHLLFS